MRSYDPLSPEQLTRCVGEAQAGRREAFDLLVRHFASMVHGVLLAHAPRTEVHDLLQDVMLKAWQSLPGLREPLTFGSWLATLARHRAMDFQRRRKPEVSIDALDMADVRSGRDAEAVRILELIRTLPEAYREPLILRLVEGLTGPEIADRTGLSHGSVRVNLHRGFELLRTKLGVIR